MRVKMEWATYGGGTAALPGKNSYDTKGWYGEFHVWPPSRDPGNGRLSPDYKLQWANTTGMPAPRPGLWHDLGKFRSPASAQKAAREYVERNFAGHEGAGMA